MRRRAGSLRFKPRPVAPEAVGLERALELVALSESASDGVIEATLAGVLTGWSGGAERMFGYTPEEILGKSLLLLSPGDRAEESLALHDAVRAGERFELETERVAKDGRVLKVRITGAPVLDDDGKVAGGIGIYRDLSEQRRTEEALRASERRYQSVVEALNEGVMMHDASGRVVTANQERRADLGSERGEADRKHLTATSRVVRPRGRFAFSPRRTSNDHQHAHR